MKLYQDAHCPMGLPQFAQLSSIAHVDSSLFNHQPASYFSDLRQSIEQAENLICITGWAVWDKLHLLRGLESDGITLGQLLVDKANSGVAVYVMVIKIKFLKIFLARIRSNKYLYNQSF